MGLCSRSVDPSCVVNDKTPAVSITASSDRSRYLMSSQIAAARSSSAPAHAVCDRNLIWRREPTDVLLSIPWRGCGLERSVTRVSAGQGPFERRTDTVTCLTVPAPNRSFTRSVIIRLCCRTSAAHMGELAASTRTPPCNRSGAVCDARCVPTTWCHVALRSPAVRWDCHPRRAASARSPSLIGGGARCDLASGPASPSGSNHRRRCVMTAR